MRLMFYEASAKYNNVVNVDQGVLEFDERYNNVHHSLKSGRIVDLSRGIYVYLYKILNGTKAVVFISLSSNSICQ